jgi:hypothetical protein
MKPYPVRLLLLVFALLLAVARPAAAAGPAAPSLLSPASGASVPEPLTISWSAVSDPSGIAAYNWQVSTSSTFGTVILQNSTNGQTQDTVSGLANGQYFWRVQAVNGQFVQGAWSAARSFTISGTSGGPAAPALDQTKGYTTFHPLEVITFTWSAAQGATKYLLQYATDPSFPVATRGQFDNIPDPTMSFAIGNEGAYYARVFSVDANGVLSAPSNTIQFSVFYKNPLPAPPTIISPVGAGTITLPVTMNWNHVPNPQPSGYEIQIAKDSGFSNIEIDSPQLNGPSRTELSLTPGTKYWRVRSAQGDSSATTAALTGWSSAGSFTVSQAPASPVSLTPTSNPVYSGNSTAIAIQLSAAAGPSGAIINLTSSNQAAAPVPASVTMPANTAWMQFQIQAGQVTADTPVTITASLNSGNASVQLNILPPTLKSLTMNPSSISGGATATGFATLNGLAPAGGAAINFSSDNPAAMAPAVATVPAGGNSVSVQIPTNGVSANTLANITASYNGVNAQSSLTITPQGQPATFTLIPASVTGGGGSVGRVTIAAAVSFDQTFQLSNSNPGAVSMPNSVTVPAGSIQAGFNINTSVVSTATSAVISVTGGGVTKSATLSVAPSSTAPASQPVTVTLSVSGRSGERVTSTPAGLSVAVGSTGSAQFGSGTSITLTVSNGRDAIWSGACSSGGGKAKSCTFKPTTNSTVSANVQ